MYPTFAREAKEEGFDEIAEHFRHVAEIEGMHRRRFDSYLGDIVNKECFKKNTDVIWQCSKCGFFTNSKKAPDKCPVCSHPQGYFFEECETY